MAGRKRAVTSSTDLGSHPVVIKTLSGPAWPRTPLSPTLSPSSGRQKPAGQRPSRPLLVPLSYVHPGRISPIGLPLAPSSYPHPVQQLSPAPVCLCDFFFFFFSGCRAKPASSWKASLHGFELCILNQQHA